MKEATKRCPRCHKRILEGGDYAEEIQTEEYGEGGDTFAKNFPCGEIEIQTEEYGEGGDKMDWPVTQSYVDSDRGVW